MRKQLIKFFSVYDYWNLIVIPFSLILLLFNIKVKTDYKLYAYFESIITYSVFLVAFLVYRKDLVSDLKKFIKKKDKLQTILSIVVIAFLCEIVTGLVVRSLIGAFGLPEVSSENNELTMKLLKSAPVLMGIGAAILGPIYEETIMRLGFSKIFKNKKVFFAASGIIFGIMHVVDSTLVIVTIPIIFVLIDRVMSSEKENKKLLSAATVILYLILILTLKIILSGGISNFLGSFKLSEALYAIQYVSMGFVLAWAYLKNNNICYSIIPHMLINALAVFALYFV